MFNGVFCTEVVDFACVNGMLEILLATSQTVEYYFELEINLSNTKTQPVDHSLDAVNIEWEPM